MSLLVFILRTLTNINYNCIYNPYEKNEEKCESIELAKDTIVQNTLKEIIEQFDKNYEISKEELNTSITSKLEYFKNLFDRLQEIKKNNSLKYNNIRIKYRK